MYGMPVYDEFDPTPVLAPFFLLFWAFCMGDAGYGLLLIALGLLLCLERTGLWKVLENRIETTIQSDLDLQMLRKNAALISSRLSNICGRQMEFVVEREKASEDTENKDSAEVPVQVQVLLNAFKGTVVSGK